MDNWCRSGCPVLQRGKGRGKPWEFDLDAVKEWWQSGDTVRGPNVSAATARLREAQADKTELEVAVLRGRLLDVGDVELAMADMVMRVRARLLALPSKLAARVIAVADEGLAAVDAVIRDDVNEGLEELADSGAIDAWIRERLAAHGQGATRIASTAGSDSKPVVRRKPRTQQGKQRRARKVAD